MTKFILSIDGGGIRGLIPCSFLVELERTTGKKCNEIFDLMAGTSTGSILAAALAIGTPAEEIQNMYKTKGEDIFHRGFVRGAFDHLGLIASKYPSTGLQKTLEDFFGSKTFSDCKPFLLIPSLDMHSGKATFFKSSNHADQRLAWVTQCSSSAPTFFPDKDGFVDGGMIANDPVMCAYVEAKKMWPNDDIYVLSLGTGKKKEQGVKLSTEGIGAWAPIIADTLLNGSTGVAEYQANYVLGDKYKRVQTELPADYCKMDNVDPAYLLYLQGLGSSLWRLSGTDVMLFLHPY